MMTEKVEPSPPDHVHLGDSMQALVYEAPRTMNMQTLDTPKPGPHDAVIAVEYSGICGSELSGFVGESSIRQAPLVFGHEVSGTIAALGNEAAAMGDLRVGQAVTANPLVSCGHCDYCIRGRFQLCPNRLLLGASLPGSNAEFVGVPARSVLVLPENMDLARAATVEPIAFALHAVEVSSVTPSMSALVIGAGAIGLFILQVLAASGVENRFVVERNRDRRALAEAMGCVALEPGDSSLADAVQGATRGSGVDVAFDAVGSPVTRRDCLLALRPGGTLVLVGLHSDETSLPLNLAVRNELTIAGAFAYSPAHFRQGLQWLAEGRVGLRDGVVIDALQNGQSWFERLVSGDPAAKVLLRPGKLHSAASSNR